MKQQPQACPETGKVCYDKRGAESARNHRSAPRRGKRRHNTPEFLRIYECPHCLKWHLTKKAHPSD